MRQCRFLVIGAGMAGASAAAALAETGPTVVIERESRPGYHSTGRSAAHFTETYGPPVVRALTRASRPFFEAPPDGFGDHPLLLPRGAMVVGRDIAVLERTAARDSALVPSVRLISAAEVLERVPVLRPETVAGGVLEPDSRDIDVASVHQGFLRRFRAAGGEILTDCTPLSLRRTAGSWTVETPHGPIRAEIVVDAAGAWADEIAVLAGAAPAGLVPRRRTALIVETAQPVDPAWPFVADDAEGWYFRPEGGGLFCSPADATPVPPSDVQPDELDVAIAVDRLETATTLSVRRIRAKWAGLRSFVADGGPVAGFDPAVPGFFWLAGQGGYGIQTAPALARLTAAFATGAEMPEDLAEAGVLCDTLSPARIRRAA
jgi:D-arginine dehydrogenase